MGVSEKIEETVPNNSEIDRFDKYAPYFVRGAIFGTGFVGLVVFARSVRLFTTFQHVRQIPDEFFRKQMKLRGTVAHVGDNGLLRVQHIPIFKLPFSRFFTSPSKEQGKLSVYVASVDLTEAGKEWLKQHLLWRPITFTLIRRYDMDSIECEILAKKNRLFKYNVNKELVRRGLGRIPGMDNDRHVFAFKTNAGYSRLVHDLIISEKYADTRGVGLWQRRGLLESYLSFLSQRQEQYANSFFYRFFWSILSYVKYFLAMVGRFTKMLTIQTVRTARQLKNNYERTSRN